MAEERIQRRLAAILAADVVGYSRLMERDEAGTLTALKARRSEVLKPTVSQHHGRVVKFMGDGVLIEFPSAVDAVECAVRLQEAMETANSGLLEDKRIVLRIGINLGDVVVEGTDLYGDGVNLAARLEALADAGSVFVSQTVFSHVKGKTKLDFEDLGERSLKNMAEPVHVYKVSGTNIARDEVGSIKVGSSSKPSIAVLPFDNMSGNRDQDYFTDGITEDIITDLSRFNSLHVIARHSSFAYRGKAIDVRQIGRELGVQYLLEGSIRISGGRTRVTAQLVDTTSGSHLWADRFNGDISDIFAIQDEISRSIASMAVLRLQDDRLERAASKPPNSITAYEWWLKGKRAFSRYNAQGMIEAQLLFEKAVEVDPTYARGIAGLALVHNMATSYTGWGISLDEPHELALKLARKAAQLDPTDHVAEIILGWCHMFRRQYGDAKWHFDRAHALNPNDTDGLTYRSSYLAYTAQCEEAIQTFMQALRLDPNYPDKYLGSAVVANVLCRRYEEAIRFGSQTSRDIWPEFPGWLAVAQAHLGNLAEARSLGAAFIHNVRAIWRGSPDVDERELVRWFFMDNPIQHQADIDQFTEGLRIAGVKV
jgi:TolB-like protein/class 3 adenylate cyclase